MSVASKKYTVGQMAELCNISKKQLRYYDQNDILTPKYRDPATNYRYYTEEQIEEILLLQELKSLDFPLKDISKTLAHRQLMPLREELEHRLYTLRRELEATQHKYNLTMDILVRVAKGLNETSQKVASEPTGRIEVVEFPARVILFTRYISHWNAKHLFISRRAELFKIAEELKVTVVGANMAIFPGDYLKQFSDDPADQMGDFEVCMNIVEEGAHMPGSRVLGPFQAVSTIYVGHYQHMESAYLALEAYAAEKGLELAGTSLEEYLIGATMTENAEDYVTRLYLPLKGQNILGPEESLPAEMLRRP